MKIQFTNNILVYRRLEIHDVPDEKAARWIKAGWAVPVTEPKVDEVELTEDLLVEDVVDPGEVDLGEVD